MNPRRRQGLTLAAGLLLGGLTAPGAARAQGSMVRLAGGDLVAADVGAILARGQLVVAMAANDSPPFFYTQGGQLKGTDVRMAEQLAGELKVTLRIDRSPASFNQVVDSVARGVDLFDGAFPALATDSQVRIEGSQ